MLTDGLLWGSLARAGGGGRGVRPIIGIDHAHENGISGTWEATWGTQRGRNLELDVGSFACNEEVDDWMLPVLQNAGLHQPMDT